MRSHSGILFPQMVFIKSLPYPEALRCKIVTAAEPKAARPFICQAMWALRTRSYSLCVIGNLNFGRSSDGRVGVAGCWVICVQFPIGGAHHLRMGHKRGNVKETGGAYQGKEEVRLYRTNSDCHRWLEAQEHPGVPIPLM